VSIGQSVCRDTTVNRVHCLLSLYGLLNLNGPRYSLQYSRRLSSYKLPQLVVASESAIGEVAVMVSSRQPGELK